MKNNLALSLAFLAAASACKPRTESSTKEINTQSPYVEGGESGSYFDAMHSLLADEIANLAELKKLHLALFKSAASPSLPADVANFKKKAKDLLTALQNISSDFEERLASYRTEAASHDAISAVEFTLATNHLKAAVALLASQVPVLADSMLQPGKFHSAWQKTLDVLGLPVASSEPKAIGGYLVSTERYLVKWQMEITGAEPTPGTGEIVLPKIAALDACPQAFAQPNLAGLPISNLTPDKIKPQQFCYDFAMAFAKVLEADATLAKNLRRLLTKGLSISVQANGPATFSVNEGMSMTLPVGVSAADFVPLAPLIQQALSVTIVRFTPSGVLEVSNSEEWRGVCDDEFDELDARVVCRMIGKPYVSFQVGQQGNANFWFDDLKCTGEELSLFDCPASPLGQHNCGAQENVAVKCGP